MFKQASTIFFCNYKSWGWEHSNERGHLKMSNGFLINIVRHGLFDPALTTPDFPTQYTVLFYFLLRVDPSAHNWTSHRTWNIIA